MKKLKHSEKDLQTSVLQMLKYYTDVYVIRTNSVAGKILRPNGSTGWIANNKKGCPDIILCKNGLWLGLELKSSIGRQSPEQKQAEEDIRKAGGHYFLIREIDELQKILEAF